MSEVGTLRRELNELRNEFNQLVEMVRDQQRQIDGLRTKISTMRQPKIAR